MAQRNPTHGMSSPETSPGGPVAQASIVPANASFEATQAIRLQEQTGLHLFGDKSAAADAFSHRVSDVPNAVSVHFMGLSRQRDVILAHENRQWVEPFVGAHLGPVPAFSKAPPTVPIVHGMRVPYGHHDHIVESKRRTRRRFGR